MTISANRQWFDGERVLRLEPEKKRRVGDAYLRRPYLYTGRALTDTTLINAVKHRIRHLMLFGRQHSAGVVKGLDLTAFTKPGAGGNGAQTEQWLKLGDGLGLTAYGDDISVSATADILLDGVDTVGSDLPARGAGVFVLEPIEVFEETAVDETSQCPWDRQRDALEDEQVIDGARLVFHPWPHELGPVPAQSHPCYRNQLAYQIFDYEQAHPFDLLPWEETGLALGLTHIADDGSIVFIDRYAVVRQGGTGFGVRPMLATNGMPFLWEARIQQLVAHLYDIKAQTPDIPSAETHFEVLPPAGFLPKQILDFDAMSTVFFPSQFVVNAVPVPEEQLEVVLNASAGLTPFDLHKPEKIKLLVPVPQAVYEPDLLRREVPDPIFLETLRSLIHQIRKQIANRTFLRNQAARVIGAMNLKEKPEFESPDPDEIPDEKKFAVTLQPDEEAIDFGKLAADRISDLRDWLETNTTIYWRDYSAIDPKNVGTASFGGLAIFIETLSKDIQTTEATISINFVKTEAELYRLRQLMLGNTKASRLATSPAMGKIVQGQTRTPTVEDVEAYFARAAVTPEQVDPQKLVLDKNEMTIEKMAPREVADKGESEKLANAMKVIKKTETGETLETNEVFFAASTLASILAGRMGDGAKAISMLAQPGKAATIAETAAISPAYLRTAYKASETYFARKGVLRDKKIIERVYESPAMEIKKKAVAVKADIFESLRKIPLRIIDKVTVAPADTAVFYGGSYEKFLAPFKGDARETVLEQRTRKPVNYEVNKNQYIALIISPLTTEEITVLQDAEIPAAQIDALEKALKKYQGQNRISLKSTILSKNIREGIFDPDPTDGDEASWFSVGVAALEHALEAMREVDEKLDQYEKALNKCRAELSFLGINATKWQDALDAIEDELAVLRHDALVTRSLFEEEKTRIAAINARRLEILNTYVTVLAYVRPRLVEARGDVPSVQLHGEYVSPVPACLAKDYEATDELEEMLDTFREAPLAWLTQAAPLLEKVPSVTHFVDLFANARVRAERALPVAAKTTAVAAGTYAANKISRAVGNIVSIHQQSRNQFRVAKSAISAQRLAAMTWQALKKKAEEEISLADLLSTGKGKSVLAVKAADVLEQIEDIAVCLYNACCNLTPAIRLQWATKISIFDKPVDLRHLESLPAWNEIEPFMRRDLQNLVDWLFQQVDSGTEKAVSLMNDLVRVCILLSGHAPVSAIIRGHIPAPAKGVRGDAIDLAVDKGIVKIGMVATVFMQNKVAVQGLVEDISQGAARIKVTHIPDKSGAFSIDQNAQVKFYSALQKV